MQILLFFLLLLLFSNNLAQSVEGDTNMSGFVWISSISWASPFKLAVRVKHHVTLVVKNGLVSTCHTLTAKILLLVICGTDSCGEGN